MSFVSGGNADGVWNDFRSFLFGYFHHRHGRNEELGDKAEDVRIEGKIVVGDVEMALQQDIADESAREVCNDADNSQTLYNYSTILRIYYRIASLTIDHMFVGGHLLEMPMKLLLPAATQLFALLLFLLFLFVFLLFDGYIFAARLCRMWTRTAGHRWAGCTRRNGARGSRRLEVL